jgi:hypothetical protein
VFEGGRSVDRDASVAAQDRGTGQSYQLARLRVEMACPRAGIAQALIALDRVRAQLRHLADVVQ